MPVIKTIRNHKYQIVSESEKEITVIDKSTTQKLVFSKIEGRSEAELNEEFPGIPVLKFKSNGYYVLNLKIKTRDMSAQVIKSPALIELEAKLESLKKIPTKERSEEIEKQIKDLTKLKKSAPLYRGRITHTHLLGPVLDQDLKSKGIIEALSELHLLRDTLPAEFQASYYGKKLRKPKEITDGQNIKI